MESIIAIRKTDSRAAERHFAALMDKTEKTLNQLAKENIEKYQRLSPSALEKESCIVIKNACENTPFNPENVRLVSGHKFPDIIADDYYGVEVKSTNKDHWTSTGSSIVESTRIENIENIYMLFGKLGGRPPEFKCRPYQDVLYDIAVTHSPRYLIDMQLNDGETIFDKMEIPYDTLRTSSDAIERVKKYYKDIAHKKGGQMPWWITSDDSEVDSISMNIRHWTSLSLEEQEYLRILMLILFPEVVKGDYANAAMWLASAKGIVNHCMRDNFSAGGKIRKIGGKTYQDGLPKIWGTLCSYYERIKELLCNNSTILPYIIEYNPALLAKDGNICDHWMRQIEKYVKPIKIGNDVYHIRQVLDQKLIRID